MKEKLRYDRGDIRRMNAVNVLGELRKHGALSRANIAANLGLTRATSSSIISALLGAALVRETEFDGGGRGRPGLLLELNPSCGCLISIGIDLDRISLVLANVGQVILWQEDVRLNAQAKSVDTLSIAVELLEQAVERGRKLGLDCLGISAAWAGLVNAGDGQLAHGPTSGWSHIPLKSDWEARFEVPVYVENEAHAAAIGVHHFGPRPGVRNLIYLSLGVGLAAGVYVDGALLRGKSGYSGQVGHTYFADNGIACSCGKKGCWVTEIGLAAVLRKLAIAGVELPEKSSSDIDTLEQIFSMAEAGDACVLEILNSVGEQIGQGAALLVQTFNPSQIFFGGRMGKLLHLVKPAIKASLLEQTLPYMAEDLEIVFRESDEDRLLGGLATVFDAVMTNP